MIIAIDGASRRNGKPDCLAAGGIYYEVTDENDVVIKNKVAAAYKHEGTNQQGEILGLITALQVGIAQAVQKTIYLVTDSEYVFNAVNKEWISNWKRKGWVTVEGQPIKSKELWQQVEELLTQHELSGNEIMIYHVKGHLLSIGKVTAANMLHEDPTGKVLYDAAWKKYSYAELSKPELFSKARDLFIRNHGFKIEDSLFKRFVVMNTVADYVAGTFADKIDSGSSQ